VKIRILLAFLSAVGLVALTGCDSPKSKTAPIGSTENLVIGTYSGDLSALFWIAKDRGYFSDQGVNVELRTQESGLASLAELLTGKVDLATMTEFVFARQVLEHPELRMLSVVGQTDNTKLVARKDRGVTRISDLKNKRIGLVRDSIADYHLHLFLLLHKISGQDVQIEDLPPSEEVKAVIRGDIDAALVWEPFAGQMLEGLGKNAVSWSAQSGQDYYWLLVGADGTVRKRTSAIRGVLAALALAEDFVKNRRDEAKRIVASRIGSNHMPELWETSEFTLTLSRPVILAMEAELAWMNAGQRIQKFKAPDLVNYIHFEALESVNPEKTKTLFIRNSR
jgi:ABC-type nitrate/sulfonate/bicarbonate transport system substrate-binding protein